MNNNNSTTPSQVRRKPQRLPRRPEKKKQWERNQRRKKLYAFLQRPFVQNLIVSLVASYLRFVYFSSRKIIIHKARSEEFVTGQKNMIGCFWHGRLCFAPATWPLGKQPVSMLISNHNDGQLISAIIEKLHIKTIKGSTGKDGIKALKEAVHTLTHEHSVCFTPDGPRGPRFKASDGVIAAARLSGVPIIPAGLSYSHVKIFKSWDRFFMPLPFGRLAIVWGPPLHIPKETKAEEFIKYRQMLQNRLNNMTAIADEVCGHPHHLKDKN